MYYCPTCGYELEFEPWSGKSPSDEICPSCGTQFGYNDAIRLNGTELEIAKRYDELRKEWIAGDMQWHFPDSQFNPRPKHWNPREQLRNIGIEMS